MFDQRGIYELANESYLERRAIPCILSYF